MKNKGKICAVALATLFVATFGLTACEIVDETPTLEGITVSAMPETTVYTEGDTFDTKGMVISALWSDDSETTVTDYTYAPSGPLQTSDKEIVITWSQKTCKVSITVNPKPQEQEHTLTDIEITHQPEKVNYTEGDTFDRAGMVVTAYYTDGKNETVDDYTVSPDRPLTPDDTKITVSYYGKSKTVDIVVTPKEIPVVTYWFEAEVAEFEHDETDTDWIPSVQTAEHDGQSGFYLRNYTAGSANTENNQIIFNIHSSAAASAVLSIKVGRRKAYDRHFNDLFKALELDGEDVPVENFTIPKSEQDPDGFIWGVYEVATLGLKEGDNKIAFLANTTALDWDQISLASTAELCLTREAETGCQFENAEFGPYTTLPTQDAGGRVYRFCGLCGKMEIVDLPALSDEGYTVTTQTATEDFCGKKTYTYHREEGGDVVFSVVDGNATGEAKENKLEAEAGTILTKLSDNKNIKVDATPAAAPESSFLSTNNRFGTFELKFTADKAATVTLKVYMASYKNGDKKFTDCLRGSLNGKGLAVSTTWTLTRASDWYACDTYEIITSEVVAGENTLTFTCLNNNGFNIDYFILSSTATIALA